MLTRRVLTQAALLGLASPALAADGFAHFVAGLRAEALRDGISPAILDEALGGLHPNADVIRLDRHQPEFHLTWAQYRARVLPESRLAKASASYAANQDLLLSTGRRYGVWPGVIIGIWGLESGFGNNTGGFNVIQALATLAYDGRRAAFFRGELLAALKILNAGDIAPRGMFGSYAGAMGQPQFMPSAYLRFAVDADGDGKRDIWSSRPDIFASVANYLARSGWQDGQPWGQPVQAPAEYAGPTGREHTRPLGAWQRDGIRRIDGRTFSRTDVTAALLLPDGPGGDAFLVYDNFHVIRRYNPSDFYALGVGLLGMQAS
jgi:membrane-bound lytic murein transglycosylase B